MHPEFEAIRPVQNRTVGTRRRVRFAQPPIGTTNCFFLDAAPFCDSNFIVGSERHLLDLESGAATPQTGG